MWDPEPGVTREHLQAAFAARDIDARVFFHPLSSLPMFEERPDNESLTICPRAINLPTYHDMTDEDLDRVVGVIRSVLEALEAFLPRTPSGGIGRFK